MYTLPTDILVSFLLVAISSGIMLIGFMIAAIRLWKQLTTNYNYAFLPPSKTMKCTAMVSICSYVVFYGIFMITASVVIIIDEMGSLNDNGYPKTNPQKATIVSLAIVGFISYIVALSFYHLYILIRIDHHITENEDIIPMPIFTPNMNTNKTTNINNNIQATTKLTSPLVNMCNLTSSPIVFNATNTGLQSCVYVIPTSIQYQPIYFPPYLNNQHNINNNKNIT